MKKTSILFLIFLCQNLLAQTLDRKSLIQQYELSENANIVINGEIFSPKDSLNLTKNLENLNPKLIVGITSLKNVGQIGCRNNDIVIIEYAVELPDRLVRTKFKEAKSLFKDKYYGFSQHILENGKDPVLYFDNKKIHHTEVNKVLAKIDKKQIAYVNINKTPQLQALHGQNAVNGIVVIWTKKELKKNSF